MNRHITLALTVSLLANFAPAESAKNTIKDSGVQGGVIVHIGCDDAELVKNLRLNDSYLVQGIDSDPAVVAKAREYLTKNDMTGSVTVRTFDGKRLPYVDNMVNLLIANKTSGVERQEIMRVVSPGGTAIIKGEKITKPVPPELDEWTHYHHDPEGTMVGNDTVVGPPRRIQWMGGPKWLRNHDFMSSMNAMVTANGRVFYVIDEGLRNHIFLPSKWVLIARDAFNGTVLWRKPLASWHPNNWPLKSGPGHLPRKLLAVGDRVYVAAGLTNPLESIDAATGKTVRTYRDTKPTQEIILANGTLYVLVDPDIPPVDYKAKSTGYGEIGHANSGWAWTPESPERIIMAIDADSGKVTWKHNDKVAPLSLAVTDKKVYYNNGSGVVALNRGDGKQQWISEAPAVKSVPTGGSLRCAVSEGVLVFAVGTGITALSAEDGKQLWKGKLLHTSHHCPEDLFIIDGQIWSPNTGTPQKKGTRFHVIDLHTGELNKDFVAENLPAFPMHPRCYPGRATKKYIMMNGMGTEFYKIGDTKVDINHTVRGSCIYGIMPANGLLYKSADSCACYYQSKLEHFCALAPEQKSDPAAKIPEEGRLIKGPAYAKTKGKSADTKTSWPMYRSDTTRSGFLRSSVPSDMAKVWRVEIGGKLTQPVIADGIAYVSSVEQQALYALDSGSGKTLWTYVAGAKIDSSPTLYNGTVLFGCADGWVYCLRAEDGALAWRYLVAHDNRQIISYQRLESVWPVHGSVLVQDDTLYALAGRNMFFDGGLRLVLLDPATGMMKSENIMDEKDPATGKNLQTLISAKYMPIANEDILSSDGNLLYMQEQAFDKKGKRLGIAPTQPTKNNEPNDRNHLFCQTGLLDDVWFHRSYWIYGNNCGEGWGAYTRPRNTNPCGRIMALDDTKAYGYRADQLGNMLHPRQTYTLYSSDKVPAVVAPAPVPAGGTKKRGRTRAPQIKTHWKSQTTPLLVNAMVLAQKHLFIAGPPDVADETKMLGYLPGAADDANRELQAQSDAWEGKHGSLLHVLSAETGDKLAEYKLDSIPLFDGMSAAEGKLFISMKDGSVICMGK